MLASTAVTALVIAGLASAPFLVALVRDPVTRRLATRHPRRRPVEAALVVLGALLGTAIITGSLVVGDTIDRSIVGNAYDQLGPIDEVVVVPGLAAGQAAADEFGALERFDDPGGVLDGVLPIVATPVAVSGQQIQARAQLLAVDFARARTFGDDPQIVGLTGPSPAPGTVAISRDLATRTGVGAGDTVTVHLYGRAVDAPVAAVLDQRGVAGFWLIDDRQQSYNVFVTPGTLAAALGGVDLPAGVQPPQTYLAFSNRGGVEDGADRTEAATAVIERTLADPSLAVQPVKHNLLERARATADSLSQLYVTMGAFSVMAGVLLVVNLFVMLADERRPQLGMLRALGMRRRTLVIAFAAEGWLYAVVSSALGAIAGIGIGRFISARADQLVGAPEDDLYSLDLTFAWRMSTVVQGFAVGLLISIVTIVLTSARISRLNVIAAIRNLPAPNRRRRSPMPVVGALGVVLGTAWTAASLASGEAYGVTAGPILALVGVGLLATPLIGGRPATTIASVAVLVWGSVFVPVLGRLDIQVDIPLFVVQGFSMSAAAVALAVAHSRAIAGRVARRFGTSVPVRVGVAYPTARVFRTAMTMAMFALVVLTIVYLAFIGLMFGRRTDTVTAELSGGFGIVVTSNPTDPVTADELLAIDTVAAVAPLAYGEMTATFADRRAPWPVTGFGPELVAAPPALLDRGSYADDRAAWEAVRTDPDLAIVDQYLLNFGGPTGHEPVPGDTMTLQDPATGTTRTVTVAALASSDFIYNGVFLGADGYRDLVGADVVASRFFVSAGNPELATRQIGTTYIEHGAEAMMVRTAVDAVLSQTTGFLTLMQQFVGVGLIVGVAGLSVLMVRAVRERTRDIGVLRAVGTLPRGVVRAVLLEATSVAVLGTVIGVAVAVVGSYGLVLNGTGFMEGFAWAMPWASVAIVVALTITAAALTAAIPAGQAGRIMPAQALRVVD